MCNHDAFQAEMPRGSYRMCGPAATEKPRRDSLGQGQIRERTNFTRLQGTA